MLPNITRLATGSILLLALVGCPAPTGTATGSVLSVTISGSDQSIVLGDTPTLIATVGITGYTTTTVTWSSSDTDVASIDSDGQVSSFTTGDTIITATSVADPTRSDAIVLTVNPVGTLRWALQFGTSSTDRSVGIATDADDNVYTTGDTAGALVGSNAGGFDAFIRSYDRDGSHRWTRQFGTANWDFANGIATGVYGDLYTTGYTEGALEGINAGSADAFIRSYDSNGKHRWTRQFGTASYDVANAIATDAAGNVYATGYTTGALDGTNAGGQDVFVRSYDRDGNLRWTRQFGTISSDVARGIAADAMGNVYAIGYTHGSLESTNAGANDAFVRSYDIAGNLRWTRQFGTGSDNFGDTGDIGTGIATDAAGNVYATGYTTGALDGTNAGGNDVFIRSYDRGGNLRWALQFGTNIDDFAIGIASDANGTVYATGYTYGFLENTNAGRSDGFIRSYDRDGNIRWSRQFGTSRDDEGSGIATDGDGSVYTTGYTSGDLEGNNAGERDAFIRSYGR